MTILVPGAIPRMAKLAVAVALLASLMTVARPDQGALDVPILGDIADAVSVGYVTE